uniref:Abscisic acid G-protein coupled receptor-like domain-containing protein n=1 Tax=Amphora coffeiformis TaxID=265554 RepID=A0A7S3L5E9_9STRA|mmetsp:Transcript_14018/g.26872  ORF Transcript_14018/g.26872 Transcript_14018/m.26872 type:complete len:624 (+) Transcript_14018:87-1958(+)|eukprot:scaffold1564_cov174-Amphora_coffeaeformis.AAC.5
MDVLLAVASFGMSTYMPKCVLQPPQTKSIEAPPFLIRVAANLSFMLLALSIIDSVPQSWMLFLNEQTIPLAYRVVLVLLVSSVLIYFPAVFGARIISGSFGSTSTEDSSSYYLGSKGGQTSPVNAAHRCHRPTWMGWFCWNFATFLRKLAFVLCQTVLIKPINKMLGRRSSSSSVLPTTVPPSPPPTGGNVFRFPAVTPSLLHFRLIPMMGSVTAVGITIYVVSTISPWFVRTTSVAHHTYRTMPFLSVTVSWLCSVGIFLSSVVNGFGSVSLPYSCMAGLYLEPISDDAVNRAQQELIKARQSTEDRQNELSQLSTNAISPSIAEAPRSTGDFRQKPLPSRWSFSSSNDDRQSTRRKLLTQEIGFLTTLVQELEQEVVDIRQSQEMAAQSRTRWGKLRACVGIFFSVLLVVRLIAAAWFLWRHNHPIEGGSNRGSDPVTVTVLWLIGHNYVNQQQYNTLSQVISLILTAYLSMSQVRTFIRAVDALHWRVQLCCIPGAVRSHPYHSLKTSVYTPLVASLMCCYFLACVVLTKLLVPAPYRRALALALETTSVHPSATAAMVAEEGDEQLLRFFLRIRSYAVNTVFLITALISTVALVMMVGLQRHQSMRHRPSTPGILLESP